MRVGLRWLRESFLDWANICCLEGTDAKCVGGEDEPKQSR